MKKINQFLWLCSGASLGILKRCPSEGGKYAGIGATILFTGLFAALAAGYALFTVFDSIYASILLGVVWGVMIFNLDRYIVSSMKKKENGKNEWLLATPRILLALLIAMIISKPLELKIFEKEINAELVTMQQEIYKQQEDNVKIRFTPEITNLKNDINSHQKEVADKTAHRDMLVELARQEADGTGGSGRRNPGPIYQIKKANADKVEQELIALQQINTTQIVDKQAQINRLITEQNGIVTNLERGSYNGLAARIEALSRLIRESTAIFWADWFIFLLFIAIETAPIFVKLISNRGPYDDLLEIHEAGYRTKKIATIANQSHSAKADNKHLTEPESSYLKDKLSTHLQ